MKKGCLKHCKEEKALLFYNFHENFTYISSCSHITFYFLDIMCYTNKVKSKRRKKFMSNQDREVNSRCNKVEDKVLEIEQLVPIRNSSNENRDTVLNKEEERYINIAQEVAKKCNPYSDIIGSQEALSTLSIFQLIQESTLDPTEVNGCAIGIAQFTRDAAIEVGLYIKTNGRAIDDRGDALRSIIANRLYMNKKLEQVYGNINSNNPTDQNADYVRKEAKYKDLFRAALKTYNGGNGFAVIDTVYRSITGNRSSVGNAIGRNGIHAGEEPNQYADIILNHFLLTDYNDYVLPDYNDYAHRKIVSEEEYNTFKKGALTAYRNRQEIFNKILNRYNINKDIVKNFLYTKIFNSGISIRIS